MKRIGDYTISPMGIVKAVVKLDSTKEWITCNKGTTFERDICYSINIPVVEQVNSKQVRELLAYYKEWLAELKTENPSLMGIYYSEGYWQAREKCEYAIKQFSNLLRLM